jgi:hypothetical protein
MLTDDSLRFQTGAAGAPATRVLGGSSANRTLLLQRPDSELPKFVSRWFPQNGNCGKNIHLRAGSGELTAMPTFGQ